MSNREGKAIKTIRQLFWSSNQLTCPDAPTQRGCGKPPAVGFDLQELLHFTDAQPMHQGQDAGTFLGELRRDARY